MNIQQYYKQSAAASLNASLVAIIPPTGLLIYSVVFTGIYQLMLLEIPFMIYSFFCYQGFILNRKRSQSVNIASITERENDLFEQSTLLTTFLPAPSLRLLLFTPDGNKTGEIRDQSFLPIRWFLPYFIDRFFKRKLGLYNDQDQLLFYYSLHKNRIDIFSADGEKMTTIFRIHERKKREYLLENIGVTVEKRGIPAEYSFITDENRLFAHIQSGRMPLEWGQRFVNPNTPILNMDHSMQKRDKIQLFAILSSMYVYTNH